ncbi:ABC transporter ATP-binding protein [Salicibibacter cibi]|uniref:ABC transporter ATP-binding protein n=1 Tax=Salicibibacter cibi TaxID=2743001 RepID=A0A7T6ZAM0_9BACI|nr:ABC transporter ATP-binding protein [Salicibibacter cibi]QQK79912.1 ABC transporter ATP-binding protein [Salicibibacter cibi]
MKENNIEILNVNKKIGKKHLVKELNFNVSGGEVFGFIGPNGAGKTTAIRMMVGLINISSGDVRICGHSIITNKKEALKNIGAIVEKPEMYPFMTGYQNLKFFAEISGGTFKNIQEMIDIVGLHDSINDKVSTYSLGMKQRLGIAQAMLHDPKVLIFDEPTNGLDPVGIREIRQYIRRIAIEKKKAIIVSSHLMSEIELICDRIGIIKNSDLLAVENVNKTSEKMYNIKTVQLQSALNCLRQNQYNSMIKNEQLFIQCDYKEIPEVIRLLVNHQIDIYGFEEKSHNLEDRYLELTARTGKGK